MPIMSHKCPVFVDGKSSQLVSTCHGSLHGNVPPTRCQAADAAVVRGQRAASDDVPWPMVIAYWTPGYQCCFMMISLGSLHMISFCDFSINNDHGFHQAFFFPIATRTGEPSKIVI